MRKFLMGAGATLALALVATGAHAQDFPPPAEGGTELAGGVASETKPPAQPPEGAAAYVLLADFVAPCENTEKYCPTPRAARPSTISADTPVVSFQKFVASYPQMGAEGFRRIAQANESLCREVNDFFIGLQNLDQLFDTSDNEYQILTDIYNELPGDVKRATTIMTIGQAVQTGALCVLSAGAYCIAAAANGIGNVWMAKTNKKLQLANIKLSVANIVVTRLNIWSNRLTLRLDNLWLKDYAPACVRLGYHMVTTMTPLPPMPILPPGFGRRD